MPLYFQALDRKQNEWKTTFQVTSKKGFAYITDQLDSNSIRVLLFEVSGKDTTIYYVAESFSVTNERIAELLRRRDQLEKVAVLRDGQSYETLISAPDSPGVVSVRFLHSKER